jgi:hypothetical protein
MSDKLDALTDDELVKRLLNSTGRVEPTTKELALRLSRWLADDFVVHPKTRRLYRVDPDGLRSRQRIKSRWVD